MKNTLIMLGIIASLIIALITAEARIKSLNETVSVQASNIKAYQTEVSGLKDEALTYQFTIDQVKNSRDTMVQWLDSLRREIKIRDKNLKSMSYVKTTVYKKDTIYIKDIQDANVIFNIDTIIGDSWLNTHIIVTDSTLVCAPKYKSELAIFASYKKETINPPSRFFFIRWFQKKHKVITVDVVENNPHAEIEKQRFIEVLQ